MNTKFKEYSQGQLLLLPPSIEELVAPGHMARVIDDFINQLDICNIKDAFPGGGCPAYNPVMMLKVLIYAYCSKAFSSRDIERNLKQDVVFMWLSGMQRPDHNTINRFRSFYLSKVLDEVFFQVVWMLKDQGYISLKDLFVDGTKIEANAGRYTYVWRKNTERYKESVKNRISLLLDEIDQINAKEDQELGNRPSKELTIGEQISPGEIKVRAEEASMALKKKIVSTGDKRQAIILRKTSQELDENIERLKAYESQEDILNGRNSYSKTDNGATFMRTKEDTLRPCYNPIISTDNQFIVNVTISQNPADNVGFIEHVEKLLSWRDGSLKPENYVGDAGFGNEENYEYLLHNKIDNYLKYSTFGYEQTEDYHENIFLPGNMEYDPKNDCFICPAGKMITNTGESNRVTATGYVVQTKVYECEDCNGCPIASRCKNSCGNKRFTRSNNLEIYKMQTRENLNSEKGIKLRKQRSHDVETPFADIKHNMGVRKFRLRGKEKATTEMLWIALAHNIRKVSKIQKKAA
jgi:transposase